LRRSQLLVIKNYIVEDNILLIINYTKKYIKGFSKHLNICQTHIASVRIVISVKEKNHTGVLLFVSYIYSRGVMEFMIDAGEHV